ncbi:MAG: DUF5703 family protein, partial [Mycobacterium sp.]
MTTARRARLPAGWDAEMMSDDYEWVPLR